MGEVSIIIDGKSINVPKGTTILQAAQSAGINIPAVCFHEHCKANAVCRMCMVEVEGMKTLAASCVTEVNESMIIQTRSERVEKSRKTILEMLVASVDLSQSPEILNMLQEYNADSERFPLAQTRTPDIIDDNPMFIRDYAKCLLCWRCVQVCADDAQFTYAINFSGRGYFTQIDTYYNKSLPGTTCVFCGQCIGVCPTGAIKPKREWLLELGSTPDEIMNLTHTERLRRK